MNIYITKDNEAYLRKMRNESNLTMSGLINDLLFHARDVRGDQAKPPSQKEFEDHLSVDAKKLNKIIKTPEQAKEAVKKLSPKKPVTYTRPEHTA